KTIAAWSGQIDFSVFVHDLLYKGIWRDLQEVGSIETRSLPQNQAAPMTGHHPAPGKARHSGLIEYHSVPARKGTAMNNRVIHVAPSKASISSQQPKRRAT